MNTKRAFPRFLDLSRSYTSPMLKKVKLSKATRTPLQPFFLIKGEGNDLLILAWTIFLCFLKMAFVYVLGRLEMTVSFMNKL